jgi:hypothetical protein
MAFVNDRVESICPAVIVTSGLQSCGYVTFLIARKAFDSVVGKFLPRFSALLRIPSAAFWLKQYLSDMLWLS